MAHGGDAAHPPPIEQARWQAEAAVGTEAFAQALAAPEGERTLREATSVYLALESGALPKLLLPNEALSGGFASTAQLQEAIKKGLGLKGSRK